MTATAPGIQVHRESKDRLPEYRDSCRGILYSVLVVVSQPISRPGDEEVQVLGDDVPPSVIIQNLEQAGHFEYLAGKDEDIYTHDDA